MLRNEWVYSLQSERSSLSAALVGVAGAHRYRAGFDSLAVKKQVRLRSNLGGTAEIMLRPYFRDGAFFISL